MLLRAASGIRLECPLHGVISLEKSHRTVGKPLIVVIVEPYRTREQGVKVASTFALWKFVDNPLLLAGKGSTFRLYPQALAFFEGFEG